MSGTLFPGAPDDNTSLPNPGANDTENNSNPLLNHAYQHSTANDAIKALEAKMGTTSSTPGAAGQVFYSNGPGISVWGNLTVGGDLAGTLPNPTVPALAGKQSTLVSGSNIKTINGVSILGSGDLAIAGGGASIVLTTTGTSGVATYNTGTGALNIPNYTYTLPTASTSVLGGVKVDGTTVTIASGVISSVAGTTSPLTTKGDLYTFSTVNARLAVGADTFVLTADSTQPTGMKWAAASGGVAGPGTSVSGNLASFGNTTGSLIADSGLASTAIVTKTGTMNVTNKTLDNTNTITVKGSLFTLQDATDTTKQGKFDLSNVSTSTTATYTLPGASTTLVGTAGAQTINGVKTFTAAPVIATITNTGTLTLPTTTGTLALTSSNITGTAAGLSANIAESQVTNLTTDLAAKAPLASPALTGTPTAPTAATTDSSTTLATTAFVKTAAGTQSMVYNEVPGGTVNGSNTIFTLASAPATNSLSLHKNGIRLKAGGADYTLSGSTITFVTAPATGAVLLADYNVSNTTFSVGTNSIISDEAPSGTINGANTTFTLSRAYISGALEVYVNGVKQVRGTHFTETTPASGIFTMGDAPLTGDIVTCNYQFNLNPSSNADTVDGIHANTTATSGQLYPISTGMALQEVSSTTSAVSTGTTFIPLDDTIPQITEGDQYLSVTITPKLSNSKIVVRAQLFASQSVNSSNVIGAIFNGSNVNAIAVAQNYNGTATAPTPVVLYGEVSSIGSTAAVTFTVRAGGTAGTTTVNGQSGTRFFGTAIKSYITVTEIAA